jgi:hypothetical protein
MMIKVNLFTIEIDSSSLLRFQIRFRLFQKRFHNLFIYNVVRFQHENIVTNRLTSSYVIPCKTIKEYYYFNHQVAQTVVLRLQREYKMTY